MVLNVPAERGEAHAHIQPRQGHATNISCHMGQHRRIHHRHVIKIPPTPQVLLRQTKQSGHDKSVKKNPAFILAYIRMNKEGL